jgi:selenocysteine lyase/cysteine desulfurase
MINAANLCPSPYTVNEKVTEYFQNLERNVSFQYREVFDERLQKSLTALAKFVGASVEEVGITRNTSESNNIVVNGYDFKSGEEILLWDQNHPSNGASWEQRAKRYGYSVKKISTPVSPSSEDELVSSFTKEVTSKTRLISFSHVSNTSGIALPAKKICQWAKSKGILTHVDGAQSFGMMDLNLADIGCDSFSGSSHKWLMGSLENGILYVRKENIERLWPTVISAGWKDKSQTVHQKFCMAGQRNDPTTAAVSTIVEFHELIGKKNIETRTKELCTFLVERIQTKIPQATFVSPLNGDLRGGVVIMNIPGKDPVALFKKLYSDFGIACAPNNGVRLSPHIYNTKAEMERVVDALTALAS